MPDVLIGTVKVGLLGLLLCPSGMQQWMTRHGLASLHTCLSMYLSDCELLMGLAHVSLFLCYSDYLCLFLILF